MCAPGSACAPALCPTDAASRRLRLRHGLGNRGLSPVDSANHRLHYGQTRSRVEVDFVVYGESHFHEIEVNNSGQVRPEDLRGLKSFGEDFPESMRWLLYRGRERLLRDGILCVLCEEFLLQLKPNDFPLR